MQSGTEFVKGYGTVVFDLFQRANKDMYSFVYFAFICVVKYPLTDNMFTTLKSC